MASTDQKASLRLLETAFGEGVTHFDVARSYGYGEAEHVVGKFARPRRSAITITTKFGISPPSRAMATGGVKAVARRIAHLAPGLRPLLRRGAMSLTRGHSFDLKTARASIETSLRALKTDYVDVLLMHEPDVETARSDDMLALLDECQTSGKARFVGIAAERPVAEELAQGGDAFPVMQFPDSIVTPPPSAPPPETTTVIHSPIRPGLEQIGELFDHSPSEPALWAARLDGRADPARLAELLLAAALVRNREGCVLFASRDPARIRANARLAREIDDHIPEVKVFQALVSERLWPVVDERAVAHG